MMMGVIETNVKPAMSGWRQSLMCTRLPLLQSQCPVNPEWWISRFPGLQIEDEFRVILKFQVNLNSRRLSPIKWAMKWNWGLQQLPQPSSQSLRRSLKTVVGGFFPVETWKVWKIKNSRYGHLDVTQGNVSLLSNHSVNNPPRHAATCPVQTPLFRSRKEPRTTPHLRKSFRGKRWNHAHKRKKKEHKNIGFLIYILPATVRTPPRSLLRLLDLVLQPLLRPK